MLSPRVPVRLAARLLFPFVSALAFAQQPMPDMPGMDMHHPHTMPQPAPQAPPAQPAPMSMDMPGMSMTKDGMRQPASLIEAEWQHSGSGTGIEPASTPASMVMTRRAGWMLMLHGNAFIADIQQHSDAAPSVNPRGADKLFSTNWIMPMAMRPIGPGQLTVRAMFSLEPATVTGRYYPELFQQGETAYGKPIVDGQHPHDFFMELAALYDLKLGEHALLSLYAAPVGDPALGPVAYPHRLSASEDPIAALGHHQEDSTHIAFNVLTGGVTYRWLRLEASGFHGAEPTEARWNFEPSPNGHALDSYSGRVTVSPSPNWSGQYSIGHLTSPEVLHPAEDQQRQTASVMYNRPLGRGDDNWSNTLLWGHTRSLADHSSADSYLVESLLRFRARNYAWTRIESAARTSELLPGTTPSPLERSVGHVQAYSLGYDRDFHVAPHLAAAPGAQLTVYRAPDALAAAYGRTPFGAVVFVHFRITP